MLAKEKIFNLFDRYVLNTYTREPLIFVKGKGMRITDIHGKTYLDFFPGWGVANVGHCHPKVMAAVRDQIGRLIHIPNIFYHEAQGKLAETIIRHSLRKGKVFFCNSGAEAGEAALKFARAYGHDSGRTDIITLTGSFHGRTFGALSATGQKKYQEPFEPLVPGFTHVPINDLPAFQKTLTPRTAAVFLELIQGEGGVHLAEPRYVKAVAECCRRHGILLMIDEVQTGMGRTGKMFAYQHYGIEPDAFTLAKALGGGLPIGALVVHDRHKATLKPGMHASTFGGGPVVCKAAIGVFKAIVKENMLKNTREKGAEILSALNAMKKEIPIIREVRGLGLMIGVELTIPGRSVFESCLAQGLIINCTQGRVLRLMPALNVTSRQIKTALGILEKALQEAAQKEGVL